MKTIITILLMVLLTCASSTFADDRFELSGTYSYLHFDPSISGLSARSFNPGGGGGIALNFLKILGLKAEVMDYTSASYTKTFSSSVTFPDGGFVPAGTYSATGNFYTALAGPTLRLPVPKVKPFGELLFGASGTNGYKNLGNAIIRSGGTIDRIPNQHPFTMAAGLGLDISISKRFSIRPAEVDYVLTLYSNPLTKTSQQNNFRYCGGMVFKF
jgi:hypothetical protein